MDTPLYSTVGGLKRLAKRIGREKGVPHHEALDLAAQHGGYQNFVHAHRALPEHVEPERYSVVVHQPWLDGSTRERGIAKLTFTLARPLAEFTKPHMLKGYLSCLSVSAEGELWGRDRANSADHACKEAARIGRAFQFMEVTDLRPSRSNRCYPKSDYMNNQPPIADHDHSWYDPATKQHLLTVEPYPGRDAQRAASQAEWEINHGYEAVKVNWGAIYGRGTELFLVGKRDGPIDLRSLADRLQRSRPAIQDDAPESFVLNRDTRRLKATAESS